MSISEPEAWTFSDDKFKTYDSDVVSSSEDSSDDENVFTKIKNLKKKKFKKIVEKEKLSYE
jgi:hypothetical protein